MTKHVFIISALQGENDEPDDRSENIREESMGGDDLSNTDDNITGIPIFYIKCQNPDAAFIHIEHNDRRFNDIILCLCYNQEKRMINQRLIQDWEAE